MLAIKEMPKLTPLLRPYAPEEMSAYAVSLLVNDPARDAPRCAEPSGSVPG